MKGASENTLLEVQNLQKSVNRFKIGTNGDNPLKEEILEGV
jgi:hypothetical protein